jgi:hypothetical protein
MAVSSGGVVMFSASTSSSQKDLSNSINYPGRAIELRPYRQLMTPWVLRKIEDIREVLSVSEQLFDAFFLSLIDRFIDFVQLLPSLPSAPLGSLIAEGLCRAEYCLRYWLEGRRRSDVLELYAAFSVALLYDVDQVLQSFQVNLLDARGDFMGHWNPLLGTMLEAGANYYVIVPLYRDKTMFRAEASALLVRQLIGKDIYQSLSSDRVFYFDWLAMFSSAQNPGGIFSQFIELFKNNELLLRLKKLKDQCDFKVSLLENYNLEDALLFIQWLKNEINSGRLSFNRPGDLLQILDRGIFIDPKCLARYVQTVLGGRVSFIQILHQLRRLIGATDLSIAQSTGLTQVSFKGVDRLVQSGSLSLCVDQVKEGIILREVALSLSDRHKPSQWVVSGSVKGFSQAELAAAVGEHFIY